MSSVYFRSASLAPPDPITSVCGSIHIKCVATDPTFPTLVEHSHSTRFTSCIPAGMSKHTCWAEHLEAHHTAGSGPEAGHTAVAAAEGADRTAAVAAGEVGARRREPRREHHLRIVRLGV